MGKVLINGNDLTIADVVNVARNNYQVELTAEAIKGINRARKLVDLYLEEERVMYGITTGFGKFSDVVINKDQVGDLQHNLITSHACAVGKPLPTEVVRAIMLLRANALSKGNSGIRLSTVELLVNLLNAGVHPQVPEQGSLGASGDLAPLAHIVLPMLGLGKAEYQGEVLDGAEALKKAGFKPISLHAKEGLALINGTQAMTAIGTLLIADAEKLINTATSAAALTVEALRGIPFAYDEKVHEVRQQPGQLIVAKQLLDLLKNSKMVTEQGEIRVQDAYSLRCTPQVHGASYDAIQYVKSVVSREINAATDNPLIFPEQDQVISAGNFHGQPIAIVMDFLKIALAELANISERRIERLVNPQLSGGLPAFLTAQGGLNSGLMIAQYTAASLVSENKVLAHPASVDSIPSSANQEDHVSMGTTAARQARQIYHNVCYVVAIELISAAQALEFYDDVQLGKGTEVIYKTIRDVVEPIVKDRVMNVDFENLAKEIREWKFNREVE
ncbi:histidine ammonia-lyase [Clostridium sp. 'deep sea']|uniref:histidine ammonia-lyase n=1 Tax=Clostridium sp. 'deep sea' TaxID=2779445 RepID=UPI0018966635|nr:histidine ammonia-lyase [Clostridium sp. 'deep sea']QOR36144.1 histidine ammonia-lyase [Clostridium sp. 'deep sea']